MILSSNVLHIKNVDAKEFIDLIYVKDEEWFICYP